MKSAALVLLALSCATWAQTGSVYRDPCTHLGVRPASDGTGAAVTFQVTTDWPQCPRRSP